MARTAKWLSIGVAQAMGVALLGGLLASECLQATSDTASAIATTPAASLPSTLAGLLWSPENRGELVPMVTDGTRLIRRTGGSFALSAVPHKSSIMSPSPTITASPDRRWLAYNTGARFPGEIGRAGAIARVRILNLATNREMALGSGTAGGSWDTHSTFAYFRGRDRLADPRASRISGHVFARDIRRPSVAPVRWTTESGGYGVFGWARKRLVIIRRSEGGYTETLIADRPGGIREVGQGWPIAISPSGTQLLVYEIGDGSGRDLRLLDIQSGKVIAQRQSAPLAAGDWRRDLVVATQGTNLATFQIRNNRISLPATHRVARHDLQSVRFADRTLRNVVISEGKTNPLGSRVVLCRLAVNTCQTTPPRAHVQEFAYDFGSPLDG